MKRIMILGAGILQLPAIKKSREMGLYVIAVDIDPLAVGFKYAHESLLISTVDIEQIVVMAREKKIDGIMTLATDMPVRSVAAVGENLNMTGISVDAAICATNKYKMRERLAINKVPIPRYYRTNKIEEYLILVKHFNEVFIVKPADNSGSRGIYLVKSKDEIERAFYYAKEYSRSGDILIEEYMTGREVSVETISLNKQVHVLAITDKLTSGCPYFVEIGHSQPAQFDKKTINEIIKVATDGILALGIENGPSHTEIIITDEGPKIVEIGARMGGDCITSHLVPLSTGIDMVESCIKIAINEEPDLHTKFNRASAIRFITAKAGNVQRITGVKKASIIEGVHEINLGKKVGDCITDVRCSTDRVGYVISSADNVHDAITSCEKAIQTIEIQVA